jgi:peroxiredoxin
MIRLVGEGEPAPDFEARASDGNTYDLRGLLADSYVLLLFYPGNDTPG